MTMMPDNWGDPERDDRACRRPLVTVDGVSTYTLILTMIAAFLSGCVATASYLPPPMHCTAYETVDSWQAYPIDGQNVGRVSVKKQVCKTYAPNG